MTAVIIVVSCILKTDSRGEEPETGAQWQADIVSLRLLI